MDIYSIGEIVIDFTPASEPNSFIRNAGGAPANAAISAVRNGLTASMCCRVGDDVFGQFLLETLRENNVHIVCQEPCKQAITTMVFVSLAPNGERTFTFARKPGADMFLSPDVVLESDIQSAKIIHAGSCSLSASPAAQATVKAMGLGHEAGKLVSFDINYREMMWDYDFEGCCNAVSSVLPYVDFLKVSDEEVDILGGEKMIPQVMAENQISLVVETLGASGACCYFGPNKLHIPGWKADALDTTAAGDAFWGGFLSSLLIQGVCRTDDLTDDIVKYSLNYGNASGWLCVQRKGAISSLPTRPEIESALEERGITL